MGTGSAYPSPHRGASGLILRNTASGVQWLFDCGEGTQIQVQKFPEAKVSRVTRIFISHLHGDHVFGLPGFLATMGARAAKGETADTYNHGSVDVEIYGPQGLRRFLRLALSLSCCDSSALRHLLHIVSPEDPTLDTLVHEATMHSSLEESAYEKGHTTAAGAA
ncbi:unnamed protein product, partial [Dibothriocephalus latus]